MPFVSAHANRYTWWVPAGAVAKLNVKLVAGVHWAPPSVGAWTYRGVPPPLHVAVRCGVAAGLMVSRSGATSAGLRRSGASKWALWTSYVVSVAALQVSGDP